MKMHQEKIRENRKKERKKEKEKKKGGDNYCIRKVVAGLHLLTNI